MDSLNSYRLIFCDQFYHSSCSGGLTNLNNFTLKSGLTYCVRLFLSPWGGSGGWGGEKTLRFLIDKENCPLLSPRPENVSAVLCKAKRGSK